MKLWFALRMFGQEGIRKHIRKQVALARHFEDSLIAGNGDDDDSGLKFRIFVPVTMGLVTFVWEGKGDGGVGNTDWTEKLFRRVAPAVSDPCAPAVSLSLTSEPSTGGAGST